MSSPEQTFFEEFYPLKEAAFEASLIRGKRSRVARMSWGDRLAAWWSAEYQGRATSMHEMGLQWNGRPTKGRGMISVNVPESSGLGICRYVVLAPDYILAHRNVEPRAETIVEDTYARQQAADLGLAEADEERLGVLLRELKLGSSGQYVVHDPTVYGIE